MAGRDAKTQGWGGIEGSKELVLEAGTEECLSLSWGISWAVLVKNNVMAWASGVQKPNAGAYASLT